MSVEELRGSRGQGIVMAAKLEEESDGIKKSPVYIMGSVLWKQGREGLLEITRNLEATGLRFDSDLTDFTQLPKSYRESAYLNFAACIFGVSLIFNERAIIEKEVNIKQLMTAYNTAVDGSFVPQIEEVDEEVETLSQDQHLSLIKLADPRKSSSPNRSLSRLYTDKIGLMPKLVRNLLEETKTLPMIKDRLLAVHEYWAGEIFRSNSKQREMNYR